MSYFFIILIGYLIGTSNMATYLAALKKVDLRAGGSGNPGASNAMILMGWKSGILVGVHDIGKAVAAVLLAEHLFPETVLAGIVAGVACVFGHMFPFYLKFRGGKGLPCTGSSRSFCCSPWCSSPWSRTISFSAP